MSNDPFYEALVQTGKVKLHYIQVLECFFQAFPEHRHSPDQSRRLVNLLTQLATDGRVSLPQDPKKGWDTAKNPPTPNWIKVIKPTTEIAPAFDDVTWLPQLAFASQIKHTSQLLILKQINDFLLRAGTPKIAVPIRERSLQIFGDEKKLDRLVEGEQLFGGQLRLADIGCFSVPPPLPYEALSDNPALTRGKPLLVLENSNSYWSFWQWNKTAQHYAAIIYGSGKAFRKSHLFLDTIQERLAANEILYVGDIDPEGLSIPYETSLDREQMGRMPIKPALHIYQQMLTNGIRNALEAQSLKADYVKKAAFNWLPEDMANAFLALFADKLRIPQETLGMEVLSTESKL